MEEQQGTVDQKPTAKRSSVEPIFGLLEWLAKVSVPLGAMLLAVAALYWLEFIKLYALPVDFSSSGTLSGLPALAAVIAALVGLMVMSALMPMMALVYPIDAAGHTLVHAHQMLAKGDPEKWGGGLGQRWITISIALTFLWPLTLVVLSLLPGIEGALWIFFALVIIASYGFILPVYRRMTANDWPPFDVTMIFILAVGAQLVLTFWVFYVAVKTLSNTQLFTLGIAFVICLLVCGAISAIQFIAAGRHIQGWSAQIPKWVVPAALAIMALPLAYPPLGGAIASYPFRLSPAGGGACVTLVASSLGENTAWADITDKAHPWHTLPLDFAARLDDAYYIKLAKDPATHILPAAMVTKIDGCPKPALKAAAAAQAAPVASKAPHAHKDDHMALAALITAALSALGSLLAVFFTVRLWHRSNRPLVTARIATHSGGNVGIALDILVENAGTQPAVDVQLRAKREDVEAAMRNTPGSARLRSAPERVFFSNVVLPVLANGRTVTNSFGTLGEDGIWEAGSQIPIEVTYKAMDGRRFTEPGVLLLHSDDGFAQTSWNAPADRDIVHSRVVLTDRSNA